MKNLWLIAPLFSLLVVPLSAQTSEAPRDSGNAFVRRCSVADSERLTGADTGNVLECVAYINGFAEGVEYEAFFATAKINQKAPAAFCLPDRSENGQIIRVVLKYIRDNPAEAHEHTAILIIKALGKAYPCPSK